MTEDKTVECDCGKQGCDCTVVDTFNGKMPDDPEQDVNQQVVAQYDESEFDEEVESNGSD